MKVLTVYAHPNRKSFCHAVLEQFTKGLKDAGHDSEVIDLYAIGFNPILSQRDFSNWLPDDNAPDVVEKVVKEQVFATNAGLLRRMATWWMFRKKSPIEIVTQLRKQGPKDVREQQEKVARAEALVFISPVWFVGFPAILKGWIERVFTLGFAFSLTSAGWHGDITGRLPLLKHAKALIISTTIFNKEAYEAGLSEAMKKLIDEFALHYPGIQAVDHEFFYAVNMADEKTRQGYLERAYQLGNKF
ncbi:NAD(P)H-dependent oxidoreductase [Segetibacter koreensis]|uniref:NAD(P)H-dependent oxidoreductase n=1 Tax=Segetibacter koreensis TaxID=398037 RepID=UPI00036450C5|nr:NAD(P)H-dependent oxidoreductase [Segetibacter koreensis]